MRKIYFLGVCFLFSLQMAFSQQSNTKLISVNFQQATITQVVSDIESKSGFHFYYDQSQFDSLRVTLQVNDKPLESILDQAFKNTDFHYAIVQQKVFLTKGRQIKTELAAGFSTTQQDNSPAKQTTAVADYT